MLGATTTCWSIWLCRNDLIVEKKTYLLSLRVSFFGSPLAMHMGYPPKAFCTGFGVEGIITIDACGYGIFLPGTWVAI
jgi:hypothetical protein